MVRLSTWTGVTIAARWAEGQKEAERRRAEARKRLSGATIVTPVQVESRTGDARPDTYPAQNLINGSGLSAPIRDATDVLDISHAFAHPDTACTTSSNGADYFEDNTRSLPAPILSFTLNAPTDLTGIVYWGYLFNATGSAIGHEPSKLRFRFFDAEGSPIGEPVESESSAPIRQRAKTITFPATPRVQRIDVEILDNFADLSGGDRVGLSEVRFLTNK